MNSADRTSWPLHLLALAILPCGTAVAQPLCDVLLRPAFHYTTDGLEVQCADSSLAYGPVANAIWDFGDGTNASTNAHHSFATPGTYSVCLTYTSNSPYCTATYCKEVVVPLDDCGGALDARFNWYMEGTNTAGFEDASVASFTGTRTWDLGDGNTSNELATAYTWALPGPHFVTQTKVEGSCTASYGQWVRVDGNASTCGQGLFVDFYTVMDGGSIQFQPSMVANGVLPVVNIWSYGDGVIDTAAVGSHTYDQPGTYQTCLLVGALTTPALDTCFALVCSSVEHAALAGLEELRTNDLLVWPNPCTSTLHFRSDAVGSPGTARLLDPLGREVRSWRVATGTGSVDLSGIPPGAYTLTVEALGRQRRARLLKL